MAAEGIHIWVHTLRMRLVLAEFEVNLLRFI